MTTKICSKCGKEKDLNEYYVKNGKTIRSECKECGRQMCRDYKARNRKKISVYNQEYKADHREEISKYNHKYNKENRDIIQKRQTRVNRKRRKNDQNYKMSLRLRKIIYQYAKSNGKLKKSAEKLLKCNWIFLKLWFEYIFLFDPIMTWDNHGSYWSIDHVVPCSLFDLTKVDEQELCFHWTNTRPLFKYDNYSKTNKIDPEDIDDHISKIKSFLQYIPMYNNIHYELPNNSNCK